VDGDPPRLLASRSELGYTGSAIRALPGEPEAVAEHVQQRLTDEAHASARRRSRDARIRTRDELLRERDYHQALLTHLERELARLDRRITR
jgi:hypothetical protein